MAIPVLDQRVEPAIGGVLAVPDGPHVVVAAARQPLTRDLAARATVYLRARTHYGIVEPATLDPVRPIWLAVLGEHDLRALDDLYAKVIWIPDGELERLDDAAREYRLIVGEPDRRSNAGGAGESGGSGEGGGEAESGEGDGPNPGNGPGAESLADALERAITTAEAGQLQQLDEDIDLQHLLDNAAKAMSQLASSGPAGGPGCRADGCPTAGSTGRRIPTRCSTPPLRR